MLARSAQSSSPPVSWPVMALGGAAVTAAASWVLCAGVAVLGWLGTEPGSLGGALQSGTAFWLLSNGVGVRIGTSPVTLVPWGATAVIAFMISRFAAAERSAGLCRPEDECRADQHRHGCCLSAARSRRRQCCGVSRGRLQPVGRR